MIATESGSISSVNHCLPRRCFPVLASNRLGLQRFGSFRASEGLDSGLLEIYQPLQVIAGCHHRHRRVRLCLADGAQPSAHHLFDGPKHMLDPCAVLGDALVMALRALGQGLVAQILPLDLVTESVFLQTGFALHRRIAPVGIYILTRVDCVEVRAAGRAGSVSLDLTDKLVLSIGSNSNRCPSGVVWRASSLRASRFARSRLSRLRCCNQ